MMINRLWPAIALFLVGCFFGSTTTTRAIINGSRAGISEAPWMAAIVKKGNFSTPAVMGGGSLIGQQWVITAAHCVRTETAATIQVWLGTKDVTDTAARRVRNVIAIYRHPNFIVETNGTKYDAALLLLDNPIGYPTLALPAPGDPVSPDDPATVYGWGSISPDKIAATDWLRKAPLLIWDRDKASQVIGMPLMEAHLAAGDPLGLRIPYYGDSGGPLVKSFDGVLKLVGLTSFGPQTYVGGEVPTIYTNIPQIRDWVQNRINTTATTSVIKVSGRGVRIGNRDNTPRVADGTYFGRFPKGSQIRYRWFRVDNLRGGWLTIPDVVRTNAAFSIVQKPSRILPAGRYSYIKVGFRPPRTAGRFRTWIKAYTNDTTDRVFQFLLEGRTY